MKSNYLNKYILYILLAVIFSGCATPENIQKNKNKNEFQQFIQTKSDSLWSLPSDVAKSAAEDSYVRGLSYAADSNFAYAALEYEYALEYDKSATIYLSLAEALSRLGYIDRALDAAFNAYKLDSTQTHALEIIFSLFVFKRDIASAEKVALKIYEKDPSDNNLLMMGDFYSFFDQKKALEYYQKYDEANPSPEVKSILNKLYLMTGDTLRAIIGIKELARTNSNPDYAWEYFDLSLQTKQYSNLDYFLDSLFDKYSLKDRTDFLSSVIYRFYFAQEFIDDGTSNFIKKTLRITADSNYNIGGMFIPSFYLAYNLKDSTLLESLLNKSILLADTIVDVPLIASQFYQSLGMRDSSIAILERYRGKFPNNPKYDIQLGYTYFFKNDWTKAKDCFLSAYSKDTTNVEVLISLGDLYDKLNKSDSVEYYFTLALSKDSENALANNNFAFFLSRDTSRLQYAMELSQKSIDHEPNNPAYLDTYGWILFKMNNREKALEFIQKAYELDPENYEIIEHLGDIYESNGNIEKAKKYWEKSLEINPENNELIKKINKYRK
jgi:tetratricopeptide (TPR) repeat protein